MLKSKGNLVPVT